MKSATPHASSQTADGLGWFAGGLFLFGVTLGALSGASVQSGVTQTLLSALFSFVGGVLLSYGGFRYGARGNGDGAAVNLRAVGVGLSCFSVGLLLGVGGGFAAKRTQYEAQQDRDDARSLRLLKQRIDLLQGHGLDPKIALGTIDKSEKSVQPLSIMQNAELAPNNELSLALQRLHDNVKGPSLDQQMGQLKHALNFNEKCQAEASLQDAMCVASVELTRGVLACADVWKAYHYQKLTSPHEAADR